jgi:hypothetical protein
MICGNFIRLRRLLLRVAKVAKLVDALDLGSSAARRESSSLSFRTNNDLFDQRSLSFSVRMF